MISLTAARDVWAERCRRHPPAPVMTITDDGLVVGATVLAPMHRDPCGMSGLAIDGADDRILALLSAAHAKAVGPRVLDGIRRASKYWRQGKTYLASIEFALSGLPPLGDPEGASSACSSPTSCSPMASARTSWWKLAASTLPRSMPSKVATAR